MAQVLTPGTAVTATLGTDSLIQRPHDLAARILHWKSIGCHVLSPAIEVSDFASGFGVNASLVLLDPRVDGGAAGDVYFDKNTMNGKGEMDNPATEQRAPSKIGLMKIAAAAGVSWVEPYGRVDPLTIQNLWIYRVTGVYLAYDGTPQVIKGEKEIDYRDGSAMIGEWSREQWRAIEEANRKKEYKDRTTHIGGWSDRRVLQARVGGAERAETGALTRAIRTLGVKHVYTVEELRRPFVALRVCPIVDMADPEVRRQVTAGQLGGVAKLYAHVQSTDAPRLESSRVFDAPARSEPARTAVVPPPPQVAPVAPVAAVVQPSAPQPRASVAPAADREPAEPSAEESRPLPAGAVYLADVSKQELKYGAQHTKAGQTFHKWIVTDSSGVEAVTVFPKWGAVIDRAWKDNAPVKIETTLKTFRGKSEMEISAIEIVTAEVDVPLPIADADIPY